MSVKSSVWGDATRRAGAPGFSSVLLQVQLAITTVSETTSRVEGIALRFPPAGRSGHYAAARRGVEPPLTCSGASMLHFSAVESPASRPIRHLVPPIDGHAKRSPLFATCAPRFPPPTRV